MRCERGDAFDGGNVGVEIGFGAEEPGIGRGVVGVAGEEQIVGAVEKADGVGSVTGRGENFDGAVAEVDFVAVVEKFGNVPGFGRVRFGSKVFGKSPQI